jgi:hypothetical protein
MLLRPFRWLDVDPLDGDHVPELEPVRDGFSLAQIDRTLVMVEHLIS